MFKFIDLISKVTTKTTPDKLTKAQRRVIEAVAKR